MESFRRLIYDHYAASGRTLPWRSTVNPYHILVSEIMLQQTQVDRVIPKYETFVRVFPDFKRLAAAPLDRVLAEWQGLGYNRRVVALQRTADRIVREFNGTLPADPDVLATLPGIGRATACAIAAFAFDVPVVFIETNIRTVFIHVFFTGRETVHDAEILPLVAASLDRSSPRRWYSALMDYGTALKKAGQKDHRKSAGYRKQPAFHGSDRQLRGRVLKALLTGEHATCSSLAELLAADKERVERIVSGLAKDGLVTLQGGRICL